MTDIPSFPYELLWGERVVRSVANLTRADGERLHRQIGEVLADAIAAGGSSLRDHRQTSGELGYFQHCFRVYDREGQPCGCGGTVRRFVQGGRSTFYCPACQR